MSTSEDRNFDLLHQRFKKNIYASLKGRLRLEVLWRDVQQHIPQLGEGHPWRILDAGCGMGHFSRRLAGQGHELLLCDISQQQLAAAEVTLNQPGSMARYIFRHMPFQELAEGETEPFDLVLCHAVLEWLADPRQGVAALQQLVRPGGWLSLLFFNRHGLEYRHLLNGNFKKLRTGDLAGEGKYLTPDNPLEPSEVRYWLEAAGLQVVASSGVRTFVDFMHRPTRDKMAFEELLEMELHYSTLEPYRSLARYIHIIARREPTD
ncbi:MAG: methyltransferase [Thiohalophilus sp.]|uniref:methyltransferase n=1 Tax=Thiohalophilus sp. TaxID=3028392 RepID=UPI0028700EA6|nr:methyltransferase [Thiohalophilus sp.]MDR9436173.1 methyltransferase [Thiohalophilus sp.]